MSAATADLRTEFSTGSSSSPANRPPPPIGTPELEAESVAL